MRPIISTQLANKKSLTEKSRRIEEVKLYPNPTTGNLYYETEIFTNFDYKIMDVSGKTLEQGSLNEKGHKINLNNFSKGVYFITIKSDNIEQTNRIILQ